jgi:hypothetical protein
LKVLIQSLSSIPNGRLDYAALKYTDKIERRRTVYWRQEFEKQINRLWQHVLDVVQQGLSEARLECQELEKRHNILLARVCEEQLTAHKDDLRFAISAAHPILAEVQTALAREKNSAKAIQSVCQGTEFTKRYVSRVPPSFEEPDRLLAKNWARAFKGSDFDIGAMESARRAELVALDIYRSIYGEAEDLSILYQVARSDARWKIADIAAGGRWIDIKNARRSYSSPHSYSEQRIKRLKLDEQKQPVAVSGFLSPYLPNGEPVIWLGELTAQGIENLRTVFETDYLKLDLSDNCFEGSGSDGGTLRIPPWLFDYPSECYAERDAALQVGKSADFILPRSQCPLWFLVLTDRVSQSSPNAPLQEQAIALSRRIKARSAPTRPMLFLHVLDVFCQSVRGRKTFPAKELREIVFPMIEVNPAEMPSCMVISDFGESSFSAESLIAGKFPDQTIPLGVVDPLETVKELIDVLEKVAATCAERTTTFTSFKLAGSGVLRGKLSAGNWQTIFAYCGGWRRIASGVTKCGQCPIYLGRNDACESPICGKLVCNKCGYCYKKCRYCAPRQADWPLL